MLLIDLDPIIYACGFAAQTSHHELVVEDPTGEMHTVQTKELAVWKKEHPGWTVFSKETEVEAVAPSIARMIVQKTLADLIAGRPYRAFLSGRGNFRDELATIRPYKGNRDPAARPVHYKLLREYLLEWPGVEYTMGIEADDAISINAHSGAWDDYTVVSIDKDLDQIPGKHWNYTKEGGHYEVDAQRSQDCFVRQWIMGDPTDNIQGVPGIGKKKAEQLVADLREGSREEIYDAVVTLYGNHQGSEGTDHAHETARLVWLLKKPTELWEADKWIAGLQ